MTTFTTEDKRSAWTAYDLAAELNSDPSWIPDDKVREIVAKMLVRQADTIEELMKVLDKALNNWAKDSERKLS